MGAGNVKFRTEKKWYHSNYQQRRGIILRASSSFCKEPKKCFTYTACLGTDCATAIVNILVKNDTPHVCAVTAVDDVLTVYQNSSDSINVNSIMTNFVLQVIGLELDFIYQHYTDMLHFYLINRRIEGILLVQKNFLTLYPMPTEHRQQNFGLTYYQIAKLQYQS